MNFLTRLGKHQVYSASHIGVREIGSLVDETPGLWNVGVLGSNPNRVACDFFLPQDSESTEHTVLIIHQFEENRRSDG